MADDQAKLDDFITQHRALLPRMGALHDEVQRSLESLPMDDMTRRALTVRLRGAMREMERVWVRAFGEAQEDESLRIQDG